MLKTANHLQILSYQLRRINKSIFEIAWWGLFKQRLSHKA
jgi:hypothetical protein